MNKTNALKTDKLTSNRTANTLNSDVTVYEFSDRGLKEYSYISENDIRFQLDQKYVWINISNFANTQLIFEIGSILQIEVSALEKIISNKIDKKIEAFPNYSIYNYKLLKYSLDKTQILCENVTLISGLGFILTFLQHSTDFLKEIKKHIRELQDKKQSMKSDFILYEFNDFAIKNYMSLVESIKNNIINIEEKNRVNRSALLTNKIENYKRDLRFIRNQFFYNNSHR